LTRAVDAADDGCGAQADRSLCSLARCPSQTIKTLLDDLASRIEGTPIQLKDSLEHLHDLNDHDAMLELLSLHGVGPKTAGAIASYALGRDVFAVDTFVPRR
jgi:endonuclease III